MSKRKGVSAEEKMTRMLQLFHEKKEFFQLKDLEKLAPKEKGIVAQSVKEVVQKLVDNNLVNTDKIGTSVYFWSFPSEAKHAKKIKLQQLEKEISDTKSKLANILKTITQLEVGREKSDDRIRILERNEELKNERNTLLKEINKYSGNDPQVYKKKEEEIEVAKSAANRWTDNIYAVKTWCRDKFFIEEDVIDKQFGIPPELDYLD